MQKLQIGRLSLTNNLLLAPMAGITNLAMRLVAREHGAALAFTEMISVNGLTRDGKKTFDMLRSTANDRPLGIQLFGDDPQLLAEGARIVADAGDLIDINMGCPVRKVVAGGAGSALLRDPQKIAAIIRAVRRATPLPLTIKIRTGWEATEANFLETGRIAEQEGCDAITLHPRTRAQMFDGKADWTQIGQLKELLRIPVLGSGDLFTAGDAAGMLKLTGCDGVMIARGALGNPWIFRETLDLLDGIESSPPVPAERHDTACRHMHYYCDLYGERVALLEMRKHLSWYARGVQGAARFRAQINILQHKDELMNALHDFFHQDTAHD